MKQILFLFFLGMTALNASIYKKRPERKQRPQSWYNRKKKSSNIPFKLYVSGVECNLCAQSVVDLLSALDGIEQVSYTMVGFDYVNSYCAFSWTKKNENIPLVTIKQLIEKEGFELSVLEGEFLGSFENIPNNPTYCLSNTDLSMKIQNPPTKLPVKKMGIKGKISYDTDKKEFKFLIS